MLCKEAYVVYHDKQLVIAVGLLFSETLICFARINVLRQPAACTRTRNNPTPQSRRRQHFGPP